MMKILRIIVPLMMLVLLFAGCGAGAEPTVPPTEAPTQPPLVDIGGTELEPGTTVLDLTAMTYEMDTLLEKAEELPAVENIRLGTTELTMEQIEAIQQVFKNAQVSYTVELFGEELTPDTTALDMSAMDVSRTDELVDALSKLPAVAQINFVNEEGICAYNLETIGELDKVRAAAPEVKLRVCFELHGQIVTSEDERIEYFRIPIGNEGVDAIRAVLPYLTSCTYFLLDGCEIDNEVMDQLRSDFPQTKIVWRIWLSRPYYHVPHMFRMDGFLTDTHRIRSSMVNDNNSHLLRYCNEVKYLDLGHNYSISECSFVAYMPELEAAILALTNIRDLTPLENCKKLEYLEIFTSKVTDLSPLAGCTALEHLNISNLYYVDDLTPLYGLTKLKRLRVVMCDNITQQQLDEIAQVLPECWIMDEFRDPTGGGWRKDDEGNLHPRYDLLRQQMEYDIDAEFGIG